MKHALQKVTIALAILAVVAGFAVAEAASESAAAKPLNIVWFGSRGFPGDNTPIQGMLEELLTKKMGFPVTFELTGGDVDMSAVQAAMLAANELPDVFHRGNMQLEFLEQAATKFSLSTYKANMPKQAKRLMEIMNQLGKDEAETWAIYQDEADGLMWGAPRIWEWGWVPSGQMWRKDKVEDLGYDIPTTLAEAEEVFEAYKAAYTDEYALTGRGITSWQCFDLVFNAFGFAPMNLLRDGRIVQFYTIREFRESLEVLRRWYEKGYWDPDFQNHALEWMTNFAEGKYLVTQWTKDWNFPTGDDTRWLNNLRDNVPGAMAVAARHLAADENTKPGQHVWDPFLTQVTVFGKQLESDTDKLQKIMTIVDLIGMDKEVNYLVGNGIEGEHYIIPEGEQVPKAIPPVAGMATAEMLDKYGFGFYWTGTVSGSRPLLSATERMYQEFVFDDNAIYNMNSIDYLWDGGVTRGPVTDESGEPVQTSTKTDWFQLVVDVMTGAQPIEYYDEWLEFYYDSGGRAWEEHATRLYGPK